MIIPKYYEDLKVLHKNTMPNRAYYIPAAKRMENPVEGRESSDRFQMLSGEWKFRYFDSIYEVKEEFFQEGYDVSGFDHVTVPGGVGPMTIISLMRNTLLAGKKAIYK